jgi:prepilin-type N-terminal cleavage/methylation domain-containing protein
MSARGLRHAAQRGYTIVELVMSLAVLAIGASGVIAMQKVAISSNRHAKEMAIATRIAEGWADQLAMDGAIWTTTAAGNSTIASTTWLNLASTTQTVDWFGPGFDALRNYGEAFNSLGDPVDPAQSPGLIRYCAQLRFAYLHSPTTPSPGHGVIRSQIRVFWQAEDASVQVYAAANARSCQVAPNDFTALLPAMHVIYLTTSIAQTPQVPAP